MLTHKPVDYSKLFIFIYFFALRSLSFNKIFTITDESYTEDSRLKKFHMEELLDDY